MARRVSLSDELQAQTTNVIRILTDKQLSKETKIALLKTHKRLNQDQFDEWIAKLEGDNKE